MVTLGTIICEMLVGLFSNERLAKGREAQLLKNPGRLLFRAI